MQLHLQLQTQLLRAGLSMCNNVSDYENKASLDITVFNYT